MISSNTRTLGQSNVNSFTPVGVNLSGSVNLVVGGNGEDTGTYPLIPTVIDSNIDVPIGETYIQGDSTLTIIGKLTTRDCGRWLRFRYNTLSNESIWTLELANDIPVDMIIMGVQAGEAQIQFIPERVNGTSAINKINLPQGQVNRTRAKGSVFGIVKVENGYWDMFGDLADEVIENV